MNLVWKTLEAVVQSAIAKVKNREAANLSAALTPAIPEIIAALRAVLTDQPSTPQDRLRAAELLLDVQARCLQHDLKVLKIDLSKKKHVRKLTAAQAERARAHAQAKQATVAAAKEQRRIAKELAHAEQLVAEKETV
jgi:hypothetical protein